jgi:hypothetical protein
MLDGWLDSETEQQRAALEKERQGLQVQRLGLQQLLVGVACMQRQACRRHGATVVPAAAPSLQPPDSRGSRHQLVVQSGELAVLVLPLAAEVAGVYI